MERHLLPSRFEPGRSPRMMLPFSGVFIVTWTIFLLLFWAAGFPLGLQGAYTYP